MRALARRARRAGTLKRILNLYAPYLGAGIRVRHIAEDFSRIHVTMGLRWYNRNYVGTQFGGSLYSMTDPFMMLMLMQRLGRDYIVWDKSAEIDFIRPGTGRVSAVFTLDDDRLDAIRAATSDGEKHLPQWQIDVVDENGEAVARITKTLYIRRKPARS